MHEIPPADLDRPPPQQGVALPAPAESPSPAQPCPQSPSPEVISRAPASGSETAGPLATIGTKPAKPVGAATRKAKLPRARRPERNPSPADARDRPAESLGGPEPLNAGGAPEPGRSDAPSTRNAASPGGPDATVAEEAPKLKTPQGMSTTTGPGSTAARARPETRSPRLPASRISAKHPHENQPSEFMEDASARVLKAGDHESGAHGSAELRAPTVDARQQGDKRADHPVEAKSATDNSTPRPGAPSPPVDAENVSAPIGSGQSRRFNLFRRQPKSSPSPELPPPTNTVIERPANTAKDPVSAAGAVDRPLPDQGATSAPAVNVESTVPDASGRTTDLGPFRRQPDPPSSPELSLPTDTIVERPAKRAEEPVSSMGAVDHRPPEQGAASTPAVNVKSSVPAESGRTTDLGPFRRQPDPPSSPELSLPTDAVIERPAKTANDPVSATGAVDRPLPEQGATSTQAVNVKSTVPDESGRTTDLGPIRRQPDPPSSPELSLPTDAVIASPAKAAKDPVSATGAVDRPLPEQGATSTPAVNVKLLGSPLVRPA